MAQSDSAARGGSACPIFAKEGSRAIVLCDGPPPPVALVEYWLDGADLFICTDAAGHPYEDLPRLPNVVIGDFDSLTGRILSGKSGPRYLLVKEQETTDSEKAVRYALGEGMKEVVLLGATGWRLDHTLFNCSLLERYADKLRICLSSFRADAVRVDASKPVAWDLAPGTRFSLLPLSGVGSGVTVHGASYSLQNGVIQMGGPATISNRVLVPPLKISLTGGAILVTVDRAEALMEMEAED
jgi:thiamine pyrophosphokinase